MKFFKSLLPALLISTQVFGATNERFFDIKVGNTTLLNYISGAGTISVSDTIISGLNKLNGNEAVDAANIATNTASIALKAPLASPALTGNPTAPTQTALNNSTRISTTAYTDSAVSAVSGAAIYSLTSDVTAMGPGAAAATITVGAVTDAKASLKVKPSVALVSTVNLTLSGFQTIDGTLTAADTLVLATGQTSGSQNGPWMSESGAWTRPSWYPTGGTVQASQFSTSQVRLGTTYQGTSWKMTSAGAITIDTTSTVWSVIPLALNSNTVTGTLPAANLPNPTSSTLGGVESLAAASHNFLTSISTGGVPTQAQPAFSDVSGNATIAQGGTNLTSYVKGDILSATATNTLSALAIGTTGQSLQTLSTGVAGWTSGIPASATNAQTGTTYTLVIGDQGNNVTMSNAATNILTVPPNSGVAFPVGTQLTVASYGAGQTSIAAGAGVTINSADGALKLRVQYSAVTILQTAANVWLLMGDISL